MKAAWTSRWVLLFSATLVLMASQVARADSSVKFNGANGHFYQRVDTPTTWFDARIAAANMSYLGMTGHLATITSAQENAYIAVNLGGPDAVAAHWLGGYQDTSALVYSEPAGGWRWITGEAWSFTNWAPTSSLGIPEPNNIGGTEDYLEFAADPLSQHDHWNDYKGFNVEQGYIVEFEPVPVYNPANGHYYMRVDLEGITWFDARTAAGSSTYLGMPGHLATITSQAENDFVVNNLGGAEMVMAHWLGGYQDPFAPDYIEPAGGWRWITGEAWGFTNWAPTSTLGVPEPNNLGGTEDYLEFAADAVSPHDHWNDYHGDHMEPGYVVEFEQPGAVLDAQVVSVRQSVDRYGVTFRLTNLGSDVANVIKVTFASLNGVPASTAIPETLKVMLVPGASVDVFVGFPKSAGPHGAVVPFVVSGSFKSDGASTVITFSRTVDVMLP